MKKFILLLVLGGLVIINLPWIYNQIEVSDRGYRDADVLSRAGPEGKAAYEVAMRDGKITRGELSDLRTAAGGDIDKFYGISGNER